MRRRVWRRLWWRDWGGSLKVGRQTRTVRSPGFSLSEAVNGSRKRRSSIRRFRGTLPSASDLQAIYDDAMFDYSTGDFAGALEKLKKRPGRGTRSFRCPAGRGHVSLPAGDFATAIAEGHKAEKLRPNEQLVHAIFPCST